MRTLNVTRSSSNISSLQYNNNNNHYYLYRNSNNINNNNNNYNNKNIHKSASEIINKRGFKPSDCKDPNKKNFLTSLSTKLWKIGTEPDRQDDQRRKSSSNLYQLFNTETQNNKNQKFHPQRDSRKMYASSSFYSSNHPTVQEQLEMARRISSSLSDISNRRSKGQSMYENRKKRSVRWVHEGEGRAPFPTDEIYNMNSQEETGHKETLKLIMNPRGKVQDLQSLRKQGYNIEQPALSPEVCFDLVRDMNATTGKGAELFAKRRKKSENWIIGGENNSPTTSTMSSSVNYSETIQTNNIEGKQITQSINSYIKNDVTNNYTSTVYKPKIPQGWNTQINPSPSQIHDMTKDQGQLNSQSQYRDYLSMNNYNTAPRGWQSTMRYYKPVLLNPTHSDF